MPHAAVSASRRADLAPVDPALLDPARQSPNAEPSDLIGNELQGLARRTLVVLEDDGEQDDPDRQEDFVDITTHDGEGTVEVNSKV